MSDFGKQQIEEENQHGPRVFRKVSAESHQSEDSESESDSDSGPQKKGDDEDGGVDQRRLGKYERNKLRFAKKKKKKKKKKRSGTASNDVKFFQAQQFEKS